MKDKNEVRCSYKLNTVHIAQNRDTDNLSQHFVFLIKLEAIQL
jgi:hypothetical protein